MATQQFSIESPSGHSVTVSLLENNQLKLVTNIQRFGNEPFFNELFRHPYIYHQTIFSCKNEYVFSVENNYNAEIFHEDIMTLMEVYVNENTTTIPTGGGSQA